MVASPRRKQKNRVGLSRHQENRLKDRLRTTAPSEPWVEAQIVSINDTDHRGEPITVRFHNARLFPPKAENDPMRECPLCGRHTPSNSFESQRVYRTRGKKTPAAPPKCCADCREVREQEQYPPSPSALAIQQVQYRNLRLETIKVESEKTTDLRREIKRWEQTGRLPK